METTCAQNSPLLIPVTHTQSSGIPMRPVIDIARKAGAIFAALDVRLGRRASVQPGMSDRSVARLAAGEHYEDVVRWNALAYQYGGTRLKR